MIETKNRKLIPGLPETTEEAMMQIEEVENSSANDWIPLENVLDNIESRYEVYAY